MSTLETAALNALMPLLATILTAAIGAAVLAWRKHLVANPKTVPLADVLDIAAQALDAAVKSVGGTWPPTAAACKQAEQATFAVILAHKGQLEDDAVAELKTLCSTAVALKAGQPVTAPGDATVSMPVPIKALLPLVAALGLAATARAQKAPAAPAQPVLAQTASTAPAAGAAPAEGAFSHGPLLGGYLLHWQDPASGRASSSALGAGAGYEVDWGFLPENLGLLGEQPLISLGFAGMAALSQDGDATLFDLALGPAVCFAGSLLCVGVAPDVLQLYGPTVSGWAAGKFSTADMVAFVAIGIQLGGSGQLSTR